MLILTTVMLSRLLRKVKSFPCAWFVNVIQYCLCKLFFRKGGCWHFVKSPISLVVSASFGIPQNPHLYKFELIAIVHGVSRDYARSVCVSRETSGPWR